MKIRLPYWAKDIKDDGVATFIAFAKKIADVYGYDIRYYVEIDDMVRMVNKRAIGMNSFLTSHPCILENLRTSDVFDAAFTFEFKDQPTYTQVFTKRSQRTVSYTLTTHRAQLVWTYLLGCLNHNLITDKPIVKPKTPKEYYDANYHSNTYGIKQFKVSRPPQYIPKNPRTMNE